MQGKPAPKLWLRQQDLAPAHTAEKATAALAGGKLAPKCFPWVCKGADISPLDFSVWGWLGAKLNEYRGDVKIETEVGLRAALLRVYERMPQSAIDAAIGSFPERAGKMIEAEWGHFEHKK